VARGAGELARRLSDLEISMGFFGKTGIMVNLGYPLVICYIEKMERSTIFYGKILTISDWVMA
jgi:hypothetical protein